MAKANGSSNPTSQIEETPFMNISKLTNESQKEKLSKTPPTWGQNFSYYFSQFCGATSIHGIQYIGERRRFFVEKVVWTIIITLVCYFCISLILKAYNKWETSPVIVTFATTETPIYKIPFPAVTICPEVKSDPAIFNYTSVVINKAIYNFSVPAEEDRYFESLSLICDGLGKIITEERLEENLTISQSQIYYDLLKILPNDKNNVSGVTWIQNYTDQLDNILSFSLSTQGLCYSFNMLDYSEILTDFEKYTSEKPKESFKLRNWNLEDGYTDDANNMNSFPRRTFISGIDGGFQFEIFTNKSHLDYLCGDALQGFKVTLHHPSELPNMDQHFRVPLNQAVFVAIKPRMITASDALKSYAPEDRKCYLVKERHLSFFKQYTQQNCLDECLSNYTLLECHCVAFYMPRYNTYPICGPGSRSCLQRSKLKYLSTQQCNCLPSCTSLQYDVEISQTDWNWRESFTIISRALDADFVKNLSFDYDNAHMSRVLVYYKEMQFLSSERNELYGIVDFFSNTGGLLGLFIGFSVTSAIEILYFLTLRLACNIRRFGQDFWSGEPELINAENVKEE